APAGGPGTAVAGGSAAASGASAAAAGGEAGIADRPIDWRRRLLWLALAAVPSSLMLGATTYITRDISPIPLLWVVPLALYLVTLVVAFSPWTNAERLTVWGRRLLPVAAILVAYTLVMRSQEPLGLLLVVHLAGLAVAGLLCHGRLAADRPAPRHLTEFYLWVALGGALGGAFNAVLAPLAFPTLIEYPLALVAACLLRPAPPKKRPELLEFFLRDERPTRYMDAIVPTLLGGAVALGLVLARDDQGGVAQDTVGVAAGLALGFTVNMWRRPLRFGLALGAIMLAAGLAATQGEELLERDRSFFGTYRVEATEEGNVHELVSGTTLHGSERVGPGPPEPLSYYHPEGPVGQAFEKLPRAVTSNVAAVGLGTGSLACYGRAGDRFTFYELDPAVVDLARDRDLFTFLSDCPVGPRVVTGDGRRSLAAARPGSFGLVVVDAFNSDAIPLHLITREAVELYMSRTAAGGALLFHITNRYLDLEPVVANIARDLGLACLFQFHPPLGPDYRQSEWALLARAREDLGRAGEDARWRPCEPDPSKETWTDDYSNPLSVIDWG
ncbi:MAG TPA: fused MFS/spermidine synthase, partial [Thermoleophilaceae bacterium]|nr:fused MFS/spermidine synthase [Thermoleophilaceae bacterium]